MRSLLLILLFVLPLAAEKPNILLICVDDLRPEINCYGVDYIHSPNIDKLASEGRIFSRHYVQAPTCGASRFTLLTGTYDRNNRGNGALFARASKLSEKPDQPSLPRYLRDHGYNTVSAGKVSHHPGGRGGKDWDDDSMPEMPGAWTRHLQQTGDWQHPRGIMHGLANGEIRKNAKDMAVYQAEDGADDIYPDGLITDTALSELESLGKEDKPFFLAVGFIRPHLPFGAPKKYLDLYDGVKLPAIPHPEKPTGKTTWHGSGEFMKYKRWDRNPNQDAEFAELCRLHYAACVSYTDAQVGRVLDSLDKLNLKENTIVILWGDHGWHLGEHAVWGKHTLFEESLRSPLIIRTPDLSSKGKTTDAVVETLDLYPTICDLLSMDQPKGLDGQSVLPILKDPSSKGHAAIAYHGGATTVRTDQYHLIAHKNGHMELYDHSSNPDETKSVAESEPDKVSELRKIILEKLGR